MHLYLRHVYNIYVFMYIGICIYIYSYIYLYIYIDGEYICMTYMHTQLQDIRVRICTYTFYMTCIYIPDDIYIRNGRTSE